MNKWIKADEVHPDGECIVWLEESVSFSRMHSANYNLEIPVIAGRFFFDAPRVTHWMALEPPK